MLYARCALLALLAVHADAFQLGGLAPRAAASAVRAHALCAADAAELPCAQPDAPGGVLMNDVLITGTTLRSMTLADASGARVRSGSLLGDEGRAVVVFLRHLGWPLCWDYALAWQAQAERLSRAGVAGPLFVSVGEPEQLKKFLSLNPELSAAKALIDDSPDFAAYRAAGFNYLMGDKALASAPAMEPPKRLTGGKWWSYLTNVKDLSPIPKAGLKLGQVPPGVKVLGGTYALDGEEVVFSHMDEVPGATPDIEAVLRAVGA